MKARNATRCNTRDDLFHFTFKILKFSEAFINQSNIYDGVSIAKIVSH